MHILEIQETDWLTRGPHAQHHLFERLSKNPSIRITVIDYDIDKIQRANSHFIKKRIYQNVDRTINNSKVKIIRTAHLQIPYIRRLSSLITNFFQILKIIRKDRPDIIICYSMSNGLISLVLAKLFNIQFIFHYIDILHRLVVIKKVQFIAKIITKILFKYADQIIVLTKFQLNRVYNEGANPEKIRVLPNGISINNTIISQEKYMQLKKKFEIKDDDFVIFFMGWLYDFAGLKEIIDYYDYKIKTDFFNIKFLILGDGGIYNSLFKYVKEIKADWVIFAGRVPFSEITEYIALADLCLLSFEINDITKEITPSKIIEYMAMKKPVLSNSLPGVVLEIGRNNGVIFAKNQKDLIRRIELLSHNKEKLIEIGQRGYKLVKNKYLWSKILDNFKKIMIDLLRIKYRN